MAQTAVDWLGSQFGLGSVIASLVVLHLAALVVWIFLLLRGSGSPPRKGPKQN